MNNTEAIEGVKLLQNFKANDIRGSFTKVYNYENFKRMNIYFDTQEVYYSISNKDVIRGLHFQTPPFEHEKIITVIKGSVEDVIVDLRKNSATYGKYVTYNLTEQDSKAIFIPKGFAHGFKTLEDDTVMLYMVSTVYDKEHDSGIKWNSIDYDWKIDNPIISERDNSFIDLNKFISPF